MAAPTFQAHYVVSTWDTSTTPKTATPTTSAGDVLAVLSAAEDNDATLGTPSGNSLTYTLRQQSANTPDDASRVAGWTAPATAAVGWTLTQTRAGTALKWGFDAFRFSGSDGVGGSAVATAGSGGPSLNITTTGANSAVVVIVADWNAVDGTTRTWRTVNGVAPSAGNGQETVYFRNGSNYTVYAAYYSDVGAAGVKTVGLSAPAGQIYSIVAIEILGTADAGVDATLAAVLPAVTAALSGELGATGTLSATLPAITSSHNGTVTTEGAFALVMPSITASGNGTVTAESAFALVVPAITSTHNGTVTVTSGCSVLLPALTAVFTGESEATLDIDADLVAVLPVIEALLDAEVTSPPVDAVLDALLPAIVAVFSAERFVETTRVNIRPRVKDANIAFPVKWPDVRRR